MRSLQDTLSKATGDRMKAIVNTIQREQNRVIRQEGKSLLLVQGCAGSGKRPLPWHRAAYLLYKHREKMRSRDILMITPNRIFEDYTSPVLPEPVKNRWCSCLSRISRETSLFQSHRGMENPEVKKATSRATATHPAPGISLTG